MIECSRSGISADAPANDAVGAGPIAAPTATPTASIAAASTAVTRGDGAQARWDEPCPRPPAQAGWRGIILAGGQLGGAWCVGWDVGHRSLVTVGGGDCSGPFPT